MARGRSPARLVIALSVAAVLAIFLLYASFAGGATPAVQPSELKRHNGRVLLGGKVVGPVSGSARESGRRFRLRDVEGSGTVRVVYKGSVPDLFRVGREVMLHGTLRNGVFVGEKDSLQTKCPSKYEAKD